MRGLGIDHHPFTVMIDLDILEPFNGDSESLDHRLIVEAAGLLTGDGFPEPSGEAHDLVYAACRAALDKGTPLIDQLRRMPEVTAHFDEAGLQRLVDPAGYLGTAREMVDRMLRPR